MTDGTSQGLFVVVAIVIFGIFVALSYTVFGSDGISGGLLGIFEDATDIGYIFDESRLPQHYVQAVDSDFNYLTDSDAPNGVGYYRYVGTDRYITLPETINGEPLTDTYRMFSHTNVAGVAGNVATLTNTREMFYLSDSDSLELDYFDTSNVTNMHGMFWASQATELDLSNLNTSNVTNMRSMFNLSNVVNLDLSSFDTSNVENMRSLFYRSKSETINVSGFDTSNVNNMMRMFLDTQISEIDLSSFDTSNVVHTDSMFENSQVTTGYARTQLDADRFNSVTNKPEALNFIVR